MTSGGAADSRVAVVGAGISGLTAALELAGSGRHDVTVYEASDRTGGRIDATPFAGVDAIDAGADAFLARVPDAVDLANRVGLGGDLVSPQRVGAAVWYDGLHPIPDGLVLGLPGRLRSLATTALLSWRGKARAAIEPVLPRTPTTDDSIGAFVRARFGDEVHERLVDSLVGSIYATDTDRSSLAAVPQLAALAGQGRSVLLAARRQRRLTAGTATAGASPIFATPRGGVAALTRATAAAVVAAGGQVRTGRRVASLERVDGGRWALDGDVFDSVIFATPAAVTGHIVGDVAPDAARVLGAAETADVVMVTLHVSADEWPQQLRGLSGYLVPKPVQRWVTAVSFGSQKWQHWQPPGGGEILRVSLGRDAMPVMQLDDEQVMQFVHDDLFRHLGARFAPLESRITRWPGAFAQYRPHHAAWVDAAEAALPAGLYVTGASYRGIGVPACVRDGVRVAERADTHRTDLAQS